MNMIVILHVESNLTGLLFKFMELKKIFVHKKKDVN